MEVDNKFGVKPDVKPEVTPEALNAAGQSCLALATAITSLVQKDKTKEALELSEQLKLTSKAIRWLIREGRPDPGESSFSKIDTKGIELDKDSKVCQFISGFLSKGDHLAMEVIEKATANQFSKNEIFKAKEVLKIQTRTRGGRKWWSLNGQG